jgi:hypothetical protein
LFKTDNSLKLVQTVQCREFKIKAQNYCWGLWIYFVVACFLTTNP